QEMGSLSQIQRDDIDAMVSQAVASTAEPVSFPRNVVALRESDTLEDQRALRRSLSQSAIWIRRSGLLAAGIAAIAVAGWGVIDGPLSWHTYRTKVGEQRTLHLEDGSTVNLNTN